MRILIAYATTEGQTQKIAEKVGEWISQKGHSVCVLNTALAGEDTNIEGFDAYILAGSLHYRKHQPYFVEFIKRFASLLQNLPSALISVSATAYNTDEASQAAARQCIGLLTEQTGWLPESFLTIGGAIKYTKYNFIVRALLRQISAEHGGPTDTSRDHEFTDWAKLENFINTFLGHVSTLVRTETASAAIA